MDRRPRLWGLAGEPDQLEARPGRSFGRPEHLLGTLVPDHWLGVVIVATGSARPATDPDAAPEPVRFAYGLTRQGDQAASLRVRGAVTELGDGPSHHRPTGASRQLGGHVVDVAHLLLGLPCPPEPTPVARLVHLEWLTAICAAAATPELTVLLDDWGFVADLHPCACEARDTTPAALAATSAEGEATTSWSRLHRLFTEQQLGLADLDAATVALLDGPSFARFVLARRAPLHDLLRRVEIELPRAVFAKVIDTLATAGEPLLASGSGPSRCG
jgi:hypothetical protein